MAPPSPRTERANSIEKEKIFQRIMEMTDDARGKLIDRVKKKIKSKSKSNKRAAEAAAEFALSRWWRFYCSIAASAGVMGQLSR